MDNCTQCIWSGKCSTEGSGLNCNEFTARTEPVAALIAAMLRQLKKDRDAIASLPGDALGTRLRWHGCSEASIRDELLADIDAVIAKAEGNDD